MFSKRQYRILLLSAMGVFFLVALMIYLIYIGAQPRHIVEEPLAPESSLEPEEQAVMAPDEVKIQAGTNVCFKILDQVGLVTHKSDYPGIKWLGYTKQAMSQAFPDYVISQFGAQEVVLTRVIERQVEPDYILTTDRGNIVIAIKKDGHKVFYKETGLEQHDLSGTLAKRLKDGIPITPEQKDHILEDAEVIYMILQEYDE